MIDWPDTLMREIVKERCIFFLGAGVSANAKDDRGRSPPGWEAFLKSACALVTDSAKRDAIEGHHTAFYEVMKALFLTNTLVFVGCSLDDPDLLLLLEDVHILGQHEKPHYAVIRSGQANMFVAKDWRETYNIELLEYGPNYEDLIPSMEALLEDVQDQRAIYSRA